MNLDEFPKDICFYCKKELAAHTGMGKIPIAQYVKLSSRDADPSGVGQDSRYIKICKECFTINAPKDILNSLWP